MNHKYMVEKSQWDKIISAIESGERRKSFFYHSEVIIENKCIDSFNCNAFIDGHDFYLLFQTLIKEEFEIIFELDDYNNENDHEFEDYKSISTRSNPVSNIKLNIRGINENASNGECRFYSNSGSSVGLKYTLVIFDENPKIETTYVKRGFECEISLHEHNDYICFLINKCKVFTNCSSQEFLRIIKLMPEIRTKYDKEKKERYENATDTDEEMRSYLSMFHDEAWKAYITGWSEINRSLDIETK